MNKVNQLKGKKEELNNEKRKLHYYLTRAERSSNSTDLLILKPEMEKINRKLDRIDKELVNHETKRISKVARLEQRKGTLTDRCNKSLYYLSGRDPVSTDISASLALDKVNRKIAKLEPTVEQK